MKKVEFSLPNHYSNIDQLTLYRWDRYTATRDNNWLLVNYDGRQTKLDCLELTEVENEIRDQYFKAVDDRSFSNKMQKWGEIDWLKTKFMTCNFLLDELETTISITSKEHQAYLAERRYNIIEQLKKWSLKFPVLNSYVEDMNLILVFRTVLGGIKTQIAILEGELKEEGQKQQQGLFKQIAFAKMALPGYGEMNPRVMVVAEWIEICKMIDEKAKKN